MLMKLLQEDVSNKMPHASEQTGPRATTTEPVLQSPGVTAAKPLCC